jgi:hypothetical protein
MKKEGASDAMHQEHKEGLNEGVKEGIKVETVQGSVDGILISYQAVSVSYRLRLSKDMPQS